MIAVIALVGCDKSTKSFKLENSIGKTSEVLVVCSNDNWKGSIGTTIKESFNEIMPWFVMEEPLFDITQIQHENYGGIYGKYRNIFIAKIDASLKESKVEMKRDINASKQSIIVIKSPSPEKFVETFNKYKKTITNEFSANEINRIDQNFKINCEKKVAAAVEEKYGFTMQFPKGFFVATDTANFMWLRSKTKDIEIGIFINTYLFTDTTVFDVETIKYVRNTLTKNFVPGPIANSYMKISDVFPAHSERVNFKGNYATLLRSWWDVEGYKLGGAFMSYTFIDTISQQVTMLDGYVQAPNQSKRDYLLQVESILNSFARVNENKQPARKE